MKDCLSALRISLVSVARKAQLKGLRRWGQKRRQTGALLSDEFDGRARDPLGRSSAASRAGIATAGIRDVAKFFARQNSVGETTFANLAYEISEHRDAFADPSQFFCGNRVVRGVARIDIGLAEQLETTA